MQQTLVQSAANGCFEPEAVVVFRKQFATAANDCTRLRPDQKQDTGTRIFTKSRALRIAPVESQNR